MAGTVWPALSAGNKAKASEVENKFDWIEQDIVPMTGGTKTDATYDLGTSSFRWRDIRYSRQLVGPAGSAATPAITSSVDSSTGFIFGSSVIKITIGGTQKFNFDDNGIQAPSGTLTSMGYGFDQDPDTGRRLIGTGNMADYLSGTAVQVFNVGGEITKPLNPAFSVVPATATATYASGDTVSFGLDIYDIGDNFSSTLFTAPVTGKYHFSLMLNFNVQSSSTTYSLSLVTSNRTYLFSNQYRDGKTSTTRQISESFSTDADMDSGDTAKITIIGDGVGSFAVFRTSSNETLFSGHLIG